MQLKQNRIIVDTNLWISYLITKGFKRLDKLIYNDKARLIFSKELIDEFIEVSKRDKFKKHFSNNDVKRLLELFDAYGDIIKVISNISACRDIKDHYLFILVGKAKLTLVQRQRLGKTNKIVECTKEF